MLRIVERNAPHWITIDDTTVLLINSPNVEKLLQRIIYWIWKKLNPFTSNDPPSSHVSLSVTSAAPSQKLSELSLFWQHLNFTTFRSLHFNLRGCNTSNPSCDRSLQPFVNCPCVPRSLSNVKTVQINWALLNAEFLELSLPSWTNFEDIEHILAELKLHCRSPSLGTVHLSFDWNCCHEIERSPLTVQDLAVPLPYINKFTLAGTFCNNNDF